MSQAQVVTLGCRLNLAESEFIAAMLERGGDGGRTVVVNSCAVTAEAVRQTRRAIRRLRRDHPDARLLVTGCAAEIDRKAIGAMDEVDGIIPNAAKLDARSWNLSPPPAGAGIQPRNRAHTRAFVAVQNGCDHACTFCVIPQGRGASRSLPVVEVLQRVDDHLAAGAAEIVLTGVDVTSWGHDLANAPSLGKLAAAILDAFPELRRLRLSSVDGAEMDPLLIELFMQEPRMMPHVHLSLQSGDDMILKRMKRRHSRSDAIALTERLQKARPNIAIGADLIAGFPTETRAMHEATLAIVRECRIVHGHVFPFSPRPGTPAARMPQVDQVDIKARAAQLREAIANERAAWLQTLVNTRHVVLAEGDGTGHAENFARFRLPAGVAAGTIIELTATAVEDGLLLGSVA
ncbi:MiaB/RimO family radical SAM methylthiotransferase [Croceicoccus sp. F390]|uniref:MiaB/RimO family radical SAM methylthiotransferase n=1 Tax=Croceicoccus esteveae TaxID=3075597 RepID=A0ABU2ZK43_9SPHN|nr:MiaB/RimO family radical SAM methylthiotransferase [Croceicoccus sp. F390]MDT0576591.1 MiaB/RimO family radical SAM methylthiotransferase [Croceicoccus sp. F390]